MLYVPPVLVHHVGRKSGTVSVAYATAGYPVSVVAHTYPGDGAYYSASVTANGTVTVKICAAVATTPNASTYLVKVLQPGI